MIEFDFKSRPYKASVTEIGGLDDVQYVIDPRDEDLALQFGQVIVHKSNPEGSYHYDLPPGTEGDEFMSSLVSALKKYI